MAQTSFNNTIIDNVIEYLEFIFSRVSERDERGRVLKLKEYKVLEEESATVGELIHTQRSEVFKIRIYVDVVEPSGNVNTLETYLEVPRMVNNLFIIDGKSRIATNTLSNDNECRIYGDNITIDEDLCIRWKFPKDVSPVFEDQFFWIESKDLDGNSINLGFSRDTFTEHKEVFELTDNQIWKLKVKLDTDEVGRYLTYENVRTMFLLGEDRYNDSIIDKKITTIEIDFIRHLWMAQNRRNVIVGVLNKFLQYGGIYLTDIQNIFKKYFRQAQSKCIEIPSNINPLVYDSLKYKLVLPGFLAYNESFSDLIDPANTPENNNVNLINELNICTSIESGTIFIYCYDFRSGKKVKLPYFEYLTKRVLKSEYYDYENAKVIDSPEYEYKLRLKTYKTKSLTDIEYIEPSADERLSYTTRRIPLVNMSDSVRVAMGAAMIRQSIEVDGTEPRLIESGNDEIDYASSSSLTTYSGMGGVVDHIDENHIYIKDNATGIVIPMTIPSPVVGANKSLITYEPLVKPGEEVIPNQVIVAPATMTKGSYDLGTNAHVVYMNYLGYSYEDGVIVSQSYADRMTHHSVVECSLEVRARDVVQYIRPIGSKVTSRDILVNMTTPIKASRKVSESINSGRNKDVLDTVDLRTNQHILACPNNTDEGYVVDVKISRRPGGKPISEYSEMIITNYLKGTASSEYDSLPEKYRSMKLKELPEDAFRKGVEAIISFRIIKVNRMIVGSKSTNSYGSKGIVSLILPDDCMPRLDEDGEGNGRPFDVIMNPAAVIGRKNVSQLYEAALTKCIQAIHSRVGKFIENGDFTGCKQFLTTYYKNQFNKYSDQELIKAYNQGLQPFKMKVGSYAKINYDQVVEWMKGLGVHEADLIYCPDVVIYQGENGIQACSPKKARELGVNGKYYELGFVEEPVITGMTYMYKLYHAAEFSGKVTSSRKHASDPVMGKGLRRDEGQKLGEMELWSLRSHDAQEFLTASGVDMSQDEKIFLNELLLAGFMITDSMGLPHGSEYRENFKKLIEKK